MNKRLFIRILLILISSIVGILGLIYLGLGYYYKDTFSFGTRINGIYCTGHSKEEVNSLLNKDYSYDGITININNPYEQIFISAKDIDFSYDFKESLDMFLEEQNEWLWPYNLLAAKSYDLNPVVVFDEDKLNRILDSYDIFCEPAPHFVELKEEKGIYTLTDNSKHRQNSFYMRAAVIQALYCSDKICDIDDKFFYDEPYSAKEQEDVNKFTDIDNFLQPQITYVMGDITVPVDKAALTSFILRDENGDFVEKDNAQNSEDGDANQYKYSWDDEKIAEWVDKLATQYDTVGKIREFKTTDGQIITVEGGTYGNKINAKAEKEYLIQAIHNNLCEEREPEYSQKAWYQGSDDIGDTYIEVDLTNQMLYYYVEGKQIINTPVVTGNMMRRWDTPSGTNYVYFMQRNRTLRGANYATFVNYWIAVVNHIGIHDATWRKDFGGDIYLTDGSHGCINTPMEEVSKLYDMVELGTPVVMYYTE